LARRETSETRARILLAAEDLSCEIGPAHMSIEAVASRAGVSKGGLLYHFPTKHALLRALVTEHVEGLLRATAARGGDCAAPLAQARAYLSVMREKLAGGGARPGLFAAIAEDPEFIAPMRAFRAKMLAIFRRCPNPDLATVVFLATEGMVFAKLTDPTAAEGSNAGETFATLERMLDTPGEE
jgi:AcrR family transcriptional regulator